MKILIIGGTKFIGPNVIKQIQALGRHEITLFHRGLSNCELPQNVRVIYGKKVKMDQYKEEFKKLSPDVVVDMIAFTEEDTQMVLDTFKGITDRLITISSQDVYRAYDIVWKKDHGTLESLPITETSALRLNRFPYQDNTKDPNDWCNKYDKILVEDIVMNNKHIKGTILRLPAVYGPNDPQHRLFNYLKLKQISEQRPYIVLEKGFSEWVWTHSYVENVAYAIALAITNERSAGRLYNVGELQSRSMYDFIHEIGDILHWKGQLILATKEHFTAEMSFPFNVDQHLLVDSSRIRKELGFIEQTSFKDGVAATVEWELANQPNKALDYAKEDEILRQLGIVI